MFVGAALQFAADSVSGERAEGNGGTAHAFPTAPGVADGDIVIAMEWVIEGDDGHFVASAEAPDAAADTGGFHTGLGVGFFRDDLPFIERAGQGKGVGLGEILEVFAGSESAGSGGVHEGEVADSEDGGGGEGWQPCPVHGWRLGIGVAGWQGGVIGRAADQLEEVIEAYDEEQAEGDDAESDEFVGEGDFEEVDSGVLEEEAAAGDAGGISGEDEDEGEWEGNGEPPDGAAHPEVVEEGGGGDGEGGIDAGAGFLDHDFADGQVEDVAVADVEGVCGVEDAAGPFDGLGAQPACQFLFHSEGRRNDDGQHGEGWGVGAHSGEATGGPCMGEGSGEEGDHAGPWGAEGDGGGGEEQRRNPEDSLQENADGLSGWSGIVFRAGADGEQDAAGDGEGEELVWLAHPQILEEASEERDQQDQAGCQRQPWSGGVASCRCGM